MPWRGAAPPFYPSCTHTVADREARSEIIAGKLYLTNWRGAATLEAISTLGYSGNVKATHIAAVGEEFSQDEGGDDVQFWQCDITDDESEADKMAAALRDGASFIQDAITGGGCVIVHCAAGISRGATLVLAYILVHSGMTLREGFAHVYANRGCIWPNEGFMGALIALEKEVRGRSTIGLAEYQRWGDWEGPEEEAPASAPPALRKRATFSSDELVQIEKSAAVEAAEPAARARRFSLSKGERAAQAAAHTAEVLAARGK